MKTIYKANSLLWHLHTGDGDRRFLKYNDIYLANHIVTILHTVIFMVTKFWNSSAINLSHTNHVTNPKEEHGIPGPTPGTMTVINPPPHWPSGCGCADYFLFYEEYGLK